MTSSVSFDAIFFNRTSKDVLITSIMTFHRNPAVISRDIDVLVETESRLFIPEVTIQTHTKLYIFGMNRSG